MEVPAWLKNILEKKRIRRFSKEIPAAKIVNGAPARIIEPRNSYFQITLSEMHLELQREYTREFIPLGLAAVDFIYATEWDSRPFYISSKLLKNIQTKQPAGYIELNNTTILGPMPYQGGEVSLFIGLARLQVSDLAKAFCELLEAAAAPFAVAGLPQYLEVGRKMLAAVGTFFGHQDTEFLFGFRDVFSAAGAAGNTFREGYWLYTNYEGDLLEKKDLWVKDGRLWQDRDGRTAAVGFDYCLVRIDAVEARSDYSLLPFFKTWNEIEQLIIAGNQRRAESKKVEMLQQIVGSPDLTDRHKEGLLTVFTARYFDIAERLNTQLKSKKRRSAATEAKTTSSNVKLGMERLSGSLPDVTPSARLQKKLETTTTFADLKIDARKPLKKGSRGPKNQPVDPAWLTEAVALVTKNKIYDGKDPQILAELFATPLNFDL